MAYKLYIRMKMKEVLVEKQIQWVLLYMQENLADVWKENIIKDLKRGLLNYEAVEEFLEDLKEEFGSRNDKMLKVAELKKVEQGSKKMEEFVQGFRKAARESKYKGQLLIEKFKRGMNRIIQQKLMG